MLMCKWYLSSIAIMENTDDLTFQKKHSQLHFHPALLTYTHLPVSGIPKARVCLEQINTDV